MPNDNRDRVSSRTIYSGWIPIERGNKGKPKDPRFAPPCWANLKTMSTVVTYSFMRNGDERYIVKGNSFDDFVVWRPLLMCCSKDN